MDKQNNSKPIVGFTLGDINGIGPELILQTFNHPLLLEQITPIVFGSTKVLNFYKKIMPDNTVQIQQIKDIQYAAPKQVNVINCWEEVVNILPGEITAEGGKYAAQSLLAGAKALKEKKINCLITAPIHKKNIKSADFNFVGHTPFFQHFFEASEVIMLMVAENMKVALLTEHLSIKDVPAKITVSAIVNKVTLLNKILREDFLIDKPKIAVLGLNPHNGDEGLMGKEETDTIQPAVKQLFDHHLLVFGPYSADAFFARGHHEKFDAVLALYHDQGLIPFKSLANGFGVNYTAGLSVVRTSPDHGTGFDIAGKNKADIGAFQEAIFKAVDIFRNKKMFIEQGQNALKKNVSKWVQEDNKREPAFKE